MLTSFHLKNFKPWRDTGPVELRPLTILFGTNSSGKSSLEQFFLLLKQTAESTDRKLVLNPGGDQSPVNLGSFVEFIFQHDVTLPLEFELGWTLPKPLAIEDPFSKRKLQGETIVFRAKIGRDKTGRESVESFVYTLAQADNKPVLTVTLKRDPKADGKYQINADGLDLTRKPGRAWALGSPAKFYGFPEEVASYFQNADFVPDLSLHLERMLRSIAYLGPWRQQGKRLYSWTGAEPESVGRDGEDTIAAILAARDRKLSYRPRQHSKPFQIVIAEQLQRLGLIQDFRVEAVAKGQAPYRVRVRTGAASDLVDLPDVGFGVSQVLPVVVQCFYAAPGSILLIEQPELHLHPSAQANLADVLITALNACESGQRRNLQLIVETHSEHFLNRLQRRIAERSPEFSLEQEQVAAYFAETDNAGSRLTRLKVDADGNIVNWPAGFFGDSMGDLLAMQAAIAARQAAAADRTE